MVRRMATVREIAELAGVSKSTVSLVLNNKAGVSDELRAAVLRAVAELQRRQSADMPLEEGEGRVRGLSLMVLHPPVLRSSQVFSEVLQGIEAAAEQFGAQLRLAANAPDAGDQHIAHLYLADAQLRPDGVIVFGARQHEPLLDKITALGLPCVVLGREAGKYPVSGIGRDEARHAAALTQHLLDLGHRAIGFVGGETHYDYTHNRLKGYRDALAAAGIAPREAWVQLGAGDAATQRLLASAPQLTALLFVNDSYAAEGLRVLSAAGVRIPDELSVASFDDSDIARLHEPPLTSIAYERFREGQWAVKLLIEQLRTPSLVRAHLLFDARLVVRASTAPPRLS